MLKKKSSIIIPFEWKTYVSNICTKANRTWASVDVKESAYKGLVRPVLEYGSSVWDPQSILLDREKVKKKST